MREKMNPYPLGAHPGEGGIRVSFVSKRDNCGVILYDKKSGDVVRRVSFEKAARMGNIHYGLIEDADARELLYQFYEEDQVLTDPYGRVFPGQSAYGTPREEQDLKAGFAYDGYDWKQDERPRIPYEDCVCYCMHVRGFTRHSSSGVKHPGTFQGVTEKIDYLKKLGITTVELQPAYEFVERGPNQSMVGAAIDGLNYWGYKAGYYYAPKAAYASGDDPVSEFCHMVRAFHENQMEVIMQFYFPLEISRLEICEILRYWVLQYHVDGFRLIGEKLPLQQIAEDPGLSDVKLWFEQIDWQSQEVYGVSAKTPGGRTSVNASDGQTKVHQNCHLAIYRDDYRNDMRRFLKGDADVLATACYQMTASPRGYGKINFFSNYDGFTMMDMVSYNEKHNEENGENNRDGCNYNQSWNCGEEGDSRKKQVTALRKKQYKNAMSLLFLSQGTPLIFMGDEFGNSQKGNNNPYCQDNETTWLNWKDLVRNRELYEFTAKMIQLRKEHPVFHTGTQLSGTDYLAVGYPDLSYHGAEAWRPSMNYSDRQIGMMFCGKYAEAAGHKEAAFLYLAINMHWEAKALALPRLPADKKWELLYITEEAKTVDSGETSRNELFQDMAKQENENALIKKVTPRTVAIYISREKTENEQGMEAF